MPLPIPTTSGVLGDDSREMIYESLKRIAALAANSKVQIVPSHPITGGGNLAQDVPLGFALTLPEDNAAGFLYNDGEGVVSYLPVDTTSGPQNVKAWGAVGDVLVRADGAMASGGTTLTSATSTFTTADIGKKMTVRGAGSGGSTLLTWINGFISTTQVTLNDANASGGAISGKDIFYGTDDSAAIAAAVNAAYNSNDGKGGTVTVPPGRYFLWNYQLDLSAKHGVTIEGFGNQTSGGSIGTQLIFTKSTGPLIKLTGSSGNQFRNLSLYIENSAFAGNVIEGKAGTSLFRFDNGIIDMGGCGAATGINLDSYDSVLHVIRGVCFYKGAYGVYTGCNVLTIAECQFGATGNCQSSYGIYLSIGNCVVVANNNFEGSTIGTANALFCNGDVYGLTYVGNWHGDLSSAATTASTWLTVRGTGIQVTANFFGNSAAAGIQNLTGIKLSNVCYGTDISGNHLDMGSGTGCKGIDGGSYNHVGVNLVPNRIVAPTTVTGFTQGNVFGGAYGTKSAFGVGTALPDAGGNYGAAMEVYAQTGVAGIIGSKAGAGTTNIIAALAAVNTNSTNADQRIASVNMTEDGNAQSGRIDLYVKKDTAWVVGLSLYKTGSLVLSPAALATDATDGFTYIPTCAGAPTGVPTTRTGTVAMVYDTTNNHFYLYNGGWKKVTLA